MNDRQLRTREAFSLGQLLGLVPLGAVAGGLLAPTVARLLAGWWSARPAFSLPRWLRGVVEFSLGQAAWPSLATQGAIVGMLVPLAIFLWLARGQVLDRRAVSRSKLPLVGAGGAVVPRPHGRPSYARGSPARRPRR